MDFFTNLSFYFLTLVAIVSIIIVLIAKEVRIYLTSAITTFSSMAGLYILLKSPTMFMVQIIFFTLGVGTILLINAKDLKPEKNKTYCLGVKTFVSLFLLAVLVILLTPFIISQIKAQIISTFCVEQFFPSETSFMNFILILFSILIISLLSGFYTIAFWRKKWHIK